MGARSTYVAAESGIDRLHQRHGRACACAVHAGGAAGAEPARLQDPEDYRCGLTITGAVAMQTLDVSECPRIVGTGSPLQVPLQVLSRDVTDVGVQTLSASLVANAGPVVLFS